MVHHVFTLEGPSVGALAHRHDPHPEARPYDTQQPLDATLTSAGPSRERTDELWHAKPSDLHSHITEEVGDEGHLTELQPGLRSDWLPNRSTRVQPRRNPRRATQTMGPDKASPIQKRPRRREPDGLEDSAAAGVSFQERV